MPTGTPEITGVGAELPDFSQFYTSRLNPDTKDANLTDELLAEAEHNARDSWPDGSKYIIDHVIAVGGMGCILRARDVDAQRDIAMKVMLRSGADSEMAQRFIQEARIVARLEHPNIVPIHDISLSSRGEPYFTMKWVQGETLWDIIVKVRAAYDGYQERYGLVGLLQMFDKVCDGVGFAHSRGIIHLDLKPNNVMVGEYGEVIVLDWGLAKNIADHDDAWSAHGAGILSPPTAEATDSGQDAGAASRGRNIKGTLGFMAPEQAHGDRDRLDPRTDIFSLGAILYMILTHKCPIVGENSRELIRHTRDANIVPPGRRIDQAIPKELEAVVMKAMARDADDRYQTVLDLKTDIDAYLSGYATSAGRAGRLKQAWLLLRRHQREARWFMATAAVILGVLACFSVLLGAQQKKWRDLKRSSDVHEKRLLGAEAEMHRQQQLTEVKESEASRARRLAGFNDYRAKILLARLHLREFRFDRAVEDLDRCARSQRHWEWARLRYLTQMERMTIPTQAPLTAIAVTSDGVRVIAVGPEAPVVVYDARSGSRLLDLGERSMGATIVAVSADGRTIVTGGHPDGSARVWAMDTGREIRALGGHNRLVTAVTVNNNGRIICTGNLNGDVRIWWTDPRKKEKRLRAHGDAVTALALSADSQRLVTASRDGTARIWMRQSGKSIHQFAGHDGPVRAVAISDNQRLVITAGSDHIARVWSARNGKLLRLLTGHKGPILAVAFDAGGRRVVTAGDDRTAIIWDLESGQPFRVLKGHNGPVTGVAMGVYNGLIFTGSRDRSVKIWDVNGNREFRKLNGHTLGVLAVAVAPGKAVAASGGWDVKIHIWDVDNERTIRTLDGHRDAVTDIRFLGPDRLVSVSIDGTALIHTVATGQEPIVLEAHTDRISSVAADSAGDRIITGSYDRTAVLWDGRTGDPLVVLPAHSGRVLAVAMTTDGSRAATAGEDSNIFIWDAATGRKITQWRVLNAPVNAVSLTTDGNRIITGADDGTLAVRNVEDGRTLWQTTAHDAGVTALTLSADDRRLISAGWDHAARIWDLESGAELMSLTAGSSPVLAVAITADHRQILTGHGDASLIVWDAIVP